MTLPIIMTSLVLILASQAACDVTLCANTTGEWCLDMFCQHGRCVGEVRTGMRCDCDPGWVSHVCHRCCPLQCVHGSCELFDRQIPICNCELGWEGRLCDEVIKTNTSVTSVTVTPSWYWGMVGTASGIAVLLIIAMVALPYYMWKKRVLLVMKIVYHFQKFEDDDEKLYDAFISYRSNQEDEEFVHYKLFPKLEQEMEFKLCLHQRDFLPGQSIANNILDAIQNSRRSILIISPSYVNGEWPRFEYQAAQHEMLGMRHRVIPIMFKDISDVTDIDPNLKIILSSVTYIKWPSTEDTRLVNRFWKKIELSMPKKRTSNAVDASETVLQSKSNQHTKNIFNRQTSNNEKVSASTNMTCCNELSPASKFEEREL